MANPSDIEERLRAAYENGWGVGMSEALAHEAADEIARLRADFLRYANHTGVCDMNHRDRWSTRVHCSCGLDAARKRAGGS